MEVTGLLYLYSLKISECCCQKSLIQEQETEAADGDELWLDPGGSDPVDSDCWEPSSSSLSSKTLPVETKSFVLLATRSVDNDSTVCDQRHWRVSFFYFSSVIWKCKLVEAKFPFQRPELDVALKKS